MTILSTFHWILMFIAAVENNDWLQSAHCRPPRRSPYRYRSPLSHVQFIAITSAIFLVPDIWEVADDRRVKQPARQWNAEQRDAGDIHRLKRPRTVSVHCPYLKLKSPSGPASGHGVGQSGPNVKHGAKSRRFNKRNRKSLAARRGRAIDGDAAAIIFANLWRAHIELGGRIDIDSALWRLLQVRYHVPSWYANSLVLIVINSAIDIRHGQHITLNQDGLVNGSVLHNS